MPDTTHPSLLSRLRNAGDYAAWREFDSRYGDLVLRFCISRGMQHSDAEDVRQLVMLGLFRALPKFHYSPERGRFRSYLGKTVRHAIAIFQRANCPKSAHIDIDTYIEELDPKAAAAAPDEQWDREWLRYHYRLAVQTIRATYDPQSVAIFDRLLAGQSVAEVAAEFNMGEPAVHKVKQRVRDRLRTVIAEQIRHEEESDHESGVQHR